MMVYPPNIFKPLNMYLIMWVLSFDDDHVGASGEDLGWVQRIFGILVNIFEMVVLNTNGIKTRAIVFTKGFLLGKE